MPRYMVERTFTDGLAIPTDDTGAGVCLGVVDNNAHVGVTWVHSYVSSDKTKTFCIYDGPNPEAIHAAASSKRPAGRLHRPGQRARPVLLPLSDRGPGPAATRGQSPS